MSHFKIFIHLMQALIEVHLISCRNIYINNEIEHRDFF